MMRTVPPPTRFRRLLGCAVLAGCALATVGRPALPSGALDSPAGPFRAVARADAVRVQFTDPAVPVIPGGELLDVAPATAQAELNSTGVSRGYAAAPTPGQQITALPLTINGFLPPGSAALPAYPLEVASDAAGTKEQKQDAGAVQLSSTSAEDSTTASSRLGAVNEQDVSGNPLSLTSSSAWSKTRRDPGGAVVAEARSTVDGVALGSVLRLGHVAGYAKVTRLPGTDPVIESSFSVGTVTVNGTEYGLTSGGLGGQAPPDLAALDPVLGPAGVKLRLLPGEKIAGGTDSGGLQLSWQRDVPSQGKVTVTLTLGRVLALGDALPGSTAIEPDFGAPFEPNPDPWTPADPAAPPVGSDVATNDTATTGGPTSGFTSTPGPYSTPSAGLSTPDGIIPVAAGAPDSALVTQGAAVPGTPVAGWGASSFYPFLIAAGLAALSAAHLFGAGRRPRWTPPSGASVPSAADIAAGR